jgi:predicted RNase H-like HicB family nuclease
VCKIYPTKNGIWIGRRMRKMKFKVVLEKSDEGGYTVYVPSLPGCISEGETIEEAMKNIQEAIELYLEPVEDDIISDYKNGDKICAG